MQEIVGTEENLSEEMLEAIGESFFGGERVLIRAHGMEACLVPTEDLEVLQEVERK